MAAKQQQEEFAFFIFFERDFHFRFSRELEVLESVYMNEFEVISKNYPNIEVKLTFPTVPVRIFTYFLLSRSMTAPILGRGSTQLRT